MAVAKRKQAVAAKATVAKKRGRPTSYTDALARDICERVARGESLRTIAEMQGRPSIVTIWRWKHENKDFCNLYAQARVDRVEYRVEEMIDLARRALEVKEDRVPGYKLLIDTIKWEAARIASWIYGDKLIHAGDPDAPIEVKVDLKGEWNALIRGTSKSS